MAGLLCRAVWAVIQFFWGIIEKAICCLRKVKRSSCNSVNLAEIGIISNRDKPPDMVTWSSWDDIPIIVTDSKPKPVDLVKMKINEYRERKMITQFNTDPEDGIDFFEDMAPNITKQQTVLVQGEEAEESLRDTSSSLAVDPNFTSPELGVWEETGKWEDHCASEWSTFEILRETRQVERSKRVADHQKKKPVIDPQTKRSMGSTKLLPP